MLRTILLSYMAHNAEECEKWGWHINGAMREYKGPNKFLKEQIGEIETSIFHTIQRRDERGKPVKNMNAVNDMMSGLVVSDSEPLSIEDLVLCQKADENLDGKSHNINMLRESIRPGVDICFSLTIDSQICSITKQNIMDAVAYFSDQYYNNYLSKFKSTDYPGNSTVWLGGGRWIFIRKQLSIRCLRRSKRFLLQLRFCQRKKIQRTGEMLNWVFHHIF